jgi:HTH-type transcriptional regulator, sugar sensing transcriptional regulator
MTTTNDAVRLEPLRALGFSEIEARVYAFLLQNDPSTGYRISHAIGKPTANTYHAISSLERMGAVQVEDGENRLVRSVPPRELLAQLDRLFRKRKLKAQAALSELSRAGEDDRLYALRGMEQVLERAGSMIRRARSVIVADLYPGPLAELESDLIRSARRGVQVAVRSYAPNGLLAADPSIVVALPPQAPQAMAAWPGQQITLVTDAEEHLLSLFNRDMTEVHQAVWSRSTFLSCLHHNHVAMEIAFTSWESGRTHSLAEAERRLSRVAGLSLLRVGAPGLRRLQSRFGASSRTTGRGGKESGAALEETNEEVSQ